MAKVVDKEIKEDDIVEFLQDSSDFAFEIRILKILKKLGFSCQHGGLYEDPVTKKNRQFDIRANLEKEKAKIFLAIECKNLRANFPLLGHTVRRDSIESFHELVVSKPHPSDRSKQNTGIAGIISTIDPPILDFSTSVKYRNSPSNFLYPENEFVCKSLDQVGRTQNGFASSDSEFYEKFSQAVNSTYELIKKAHFGYNDGSSFISLIIPIVVVPDNKLWQVQYNENGDRIGAPQRVDRLPFFINQNWEIGVKPDNGFPNLIRYFLSHLEIQTETGVKKFLEKYFCKDARMNDLFTDKNIYQLYKSNKV